MSLLFHCHLLVPSRSVVKGGVEGAEISRWFQLKLTTVPLGSINGELAQSPTGMGRGSGGRRGVDGGEGGVSPLASYRSPFYFLLGLYSAPLHIPPQSALIRPHSHFAWSQQTAPDTLFISFKADCFLCSGARTIPRGNIEIQSWFSTVYSTAQHYHWAGPVQNQSLCHSVGGRLPWGWLIEVWRLASLTSLTSTQSQTSGLGCIKVARK